MLKGVLAAVAAVFACAPAVASVTFYTDPSAFAAAAGRVKDSQFSYDFGSPTLDWHIIGPSLTVGRLSFLADQLVYYRDAFFSYQGRSLNHNSPYLDTASSLNVTTPQGALGLYLGAYLAGQDRLLKFTTRGLEGSVVLPDYLETSFLGIIDTSGQIEVTFDRPTFDVAIASFVETVPEPATWAMMLGGFGLAGIVARRRSGRHERDVRV